ncbi:MAG: hypothetical protein ACTSO9_05685 [Candidatus Helarchaeota archaeon]
MRGVFLVKFDESKGFIPVDPIYIDEEKFIKNRSFLKEIAKNAIGFGSKVEFNSFSIKGINCIAKRFSISKEDARGGGEVYSLVIVSDKDVMRFKAGLQTTIEKIINDWNHVDKFLNQLYKSAKYPEQALIFKDKDEVLRTNSLPIYSHRAFRPLNEKSRLTSKNSPGRNLLMGIGCSIVLVTILVVFQYSQPFENFDFWKYSYTNILMFLLGVLLYSAINRKKFLRSIEYLSISLLFFIPTYTIFTRDVIFDLLHVWIYFTAFIAGLFICIGLDSEGKIDYISLYILIFLILLIILFVSVYLLTI